MKLPHFIHRDPNWQQRGFYAYHQCRCGARRIRKVPWGHSGPAEPGWPPLVDRHGRPITDSGWRQR
jgi:hypothetical protein